MKQLISLCKVWPEFFIQNSRTFWGFQGNWEKKNVRQHRAKGAMTRDASDFKTSAGCMTQSWQRFPRMWAASRRKLSDTILARLKLSHVFPVHGASTSGRKDYTFFRGQNLTAMHLAAKKVFLHVGCQGDRFSPAIMLRTTTCIATAWMSEEQRSVSPSM